MSSRRRTRAQRRLRLLAVIALVALVAIAAAWRWTPLHQYADTALIGRWLASLRHSPWAPVAIVAAYIGASLVLFPNTVLNVAVVLSLGTMAGPPYALLGSLAAATVAWTLGRRYGRKHIEDLDLDSVERMTRALRRGGVMGVVSLRLLPIAPFTVVNVAAGAARVRLLPFVLGSAIGLAPGILLTTAFGHQLRAVIRDPDPVTIAGLVLVLAVAAVGAWQLRRLAMRPAQAS
jgi:phospholipase D1/2